MLDCPGLGLTDGCAHVQPALQNEWPDLHSTLMMQFVLAEHTTIMLSSCKWLYSCHVWWLKMHAVMLQLPRDMCGHRVCCSISQMRPRVMFWLCRQQLAEVFDAMLVSILLCSCN